MKKLILLLLIMTLTIGSLYSKKARFDFPRDEEGNAFYSEVIEAPGMTNDQLYIQGLSWFAKAFRSAQDVIQMQDKEAGRIVGKTMIPVSIMNIIRITAGHVQYTVTLDFKDGKFRYSIDQFIHDGSAGEYLLGKSIGVLTKEKPTKDYSNKQYAAVKEQADMSVQSLISDLKAFMKTPIKSDDW